LVLSLDGFEKGSLYLQLSLGSPLTIMRGTNFRIKPTVWIEEWRGKKALSI